MTTEAQLKTSKRQLVLHDGLAFLILLSVTAVLFAVTLFLFRSFAGHRADLACEAGKAGRLALSQNRPRDAIVSLRTALSYAPNERDYELMLAQALGDDGRLEESTNYFLNLWESQPGDGFVNLQLARLARRRREKQSAVNYYRASVFGSWNGDGVARRRDIRLELADYLVELKDFSAAQAELLIAASNAPADSGLSIQLGDALLRAQDQADALKQYRKAMLEPPTDPLAYEKAGRLAYVQGDYVNARDWLEKALRESGGSLAASIDPAGETTTLLHNSERLIVLDPNLAASRAERISRLLNDRAIAKKRLDACSQQLAQATSPTAAQTAAITALTARWTAAAFTTTRAALSRDPANEDPLKSLIGDTELTTSQLCGPPQGDDALLLLVATHPPK